MNKRLRRTISLISIAMILLACTAITGCDFFGGDETNQPSATQQKEKESDDKTASDSQQSERNEADSDHSQEYLPADGHRIDLSKIPEWSGKPSIEINGGKPAFTESELKKISKLSEDDLSSLDGLGRCGDVTACVNEDTMPDGSRGSIGMIKPAGWHLVKYDFIDGKYLYNRCHLIGWQLTGEGAEERNLITGTRYMNVEGMLPYENQVADYIKDSGNSVAYRVEPVYNADELLARGVHIEAKSIEENGSDLSFNVYCYNVQPNVDIDYETGDSKADGKTAMSGDQSTSNSNSKNSTGDSDNSGTGSSSDSDKAGSAYILNTNTMKYHLKGCHSLSQMKNKNKRSFHGSKKELKKMGYSPCGNCNP